MERLSSETIRNKFLDFFKEKNHEVKKSALLVPENDESLLWVNSGVATLKKYFDGSVIPDNKRIVSIQKSLRTNDIENVGVTPRHQTFFEMMGNFSIGDYFKKDAILWGWEFLTSPKWLDIDPSKLYVTYHPTDLETKDIWLNEVGIKNSHLISNEDNFWDIGQGPSGPDTEIFFDRGEKFQNVSKENPQSLPGGENERFLEIWNIVFSQFNHLEGMDDISQYPELPQKNIDTGMGFERLVSIFQNANNNFETDLFLPIISELENKSGKSFLSDEKNDVSFKIIADHIRAIVFAISDGISPSNEGRGYVIRRLIRRSVLQGRKLGINEEFLYDLVSVVADLFKNVYRDLYENQKYVSEVIRNEEDKFSKTINDGIALINEVIKNNEDTLVIPGKEAFKLYDTFGFPLDLTQEYANEYNYKVDIDGFNKEMAKQKELARSSRKNTSSLGKQNENLINFVTPSKYLGWETGEVNESVVTGIFNEDKELNVANSGEIVSMIFSETPFYAEMGGQPSDTGIIFKNQKIIGHILDVGIAPHGQHIHRVQVLENISLNDVVDLEINLERNKKISSNHTATHMLDQALRNLLGNNTKQMGSKITEEFLTFDFKSDQPLTDEQILKIENEINEQIFKNLDINWFITSYDEAKDLGVIGVFENKYGDEVRVVKIGDYNQELDGGTHVKSTSELALFKIISETGVGSGVRRVQAITNEESYKLFSSESTIVNNIIKNNKLHSLDEIETEIKELKDRLKSNKREINELRNKLLNYELKEKLKNKIEVKSYSFNYILLKETNIKEIKNIVDNWKNSENGTDGIILNSKFDDHNLFAIATNNKSLDSGNIIKKMLLDVAGRGGGKKNFAQASLIENFDKNEVVKILTNII